MMLISVITPHSLLDCLIGREIDSMSRTCTGILIPCNFCNSYFRLPAPTTTLVMPLHIDVTPSILEMVETAFERLV